MIKRPFVPLLLLAAVGHTSGTALAHPADVFQECTPRSPEISGGTNPKPASDTTIYFFRMKDRHGQFITQDPWYTNKELKDATVLLIADGTNAGSNKKDLTKKEIKKHNLKRKTPVSINGSQMPSHFDFTFSRGQRHKIYLMIYAHDWDFSEYDGSNSDSLSFELKNGSSVDNFCELVEFNGRTGVTDHKVIRFYFDAAATHQEEHEFALNLFVRKRNAANQVEIQTKVTIDPKIINNGP